MLSCCAINSKNMPILLPVLREVKSSGMRVVNYSKRTKLVCIYVFILEGYSMFAACLSLAFPLLFDKKKKF